MKGYKTIFTNIALGGFALAAIFGFDVTPEQEAAILEMVLAIGALVNIYLRFITDGPVFNKPRNVVNKQKGNANVDILCGWCMLCLLGLIILFACSGCSWTKTKQAAAPITECLAIEEIDNTKILSCYKTIELLAGSVDAAADAGIITPETERMLLDRLRLSLKAMKLVRENKDKLQLHKVKRYVADVDAVLVEAGYAN